MIHRLTALALVALLLNGCVSTPEAAEVLGGPEIVLDGTDVFDATAYALMPLDSTAEGTYRAEQGGSELSMSLRAEGADWRVDRSYREPGSPEERRSYTAGIVEGVLMTESGDLEIHRTTDGILVLERASGGSIPPDYWVLYVRQ